MAPSKVPKFGDWNDEEAGYTVRFDTVRKGKPGGPIINPNDPQGAKLADVPPPVTPDQQTKPKSKRPGFGHWDEEEEVPYTQYFDKLGKSEPAPSEPQMNYKTTPDHQTKPKPKQPGFGDWKEEEEVPYTQYFDKLGKSGPAPSEPQTNYKTTPDHQTKPKPKQPGFGDWEEEEDVPYTQYFEKLGKFEPAPIEPRINYKTTPVVKSNEAAPRQDNANLRPAEPRAKPQGVVFVDREPSARKTPLHPAVAGRERGNAPPRLRNPATAGPSPARGGAAVPVFGGWKDDPSQADGYTTDFSKFRDERNGVAPKPMDANHPRYGHPTNQEQKQGGWLSCLFG